MKHESIENIITDYKMYLSLERRLSQNTIDSYLFDIAEFVSILKIESLKDIEEVAEDSIKEYINIRYNKGISSKSQSRNISSLNSFFKFLTLEEMIKRNPLRKIDKPKIAKKLPVYLSLEEIDSIISHIDLSLPYGHRNKAIIELLYSCGLRVSELTELKINQVNFKEGYIIVIGKGNKQRFVPINTPALELLKEYLDKRLPIPIKRKLDNNEYLFLSSMHRPFSRSMIFRIVRTAVQDAGITKTIGPHTFRHSFATHLITGGADIKAVQDLLGHESIATTEIYTHLKHSHLVKTIEEFHPLSKKNIK